MRKQLQIKQNEGIGGGMKQVAGDEAAYHASSSSHHTTCVEAAPIWCCSCPRVGRVKARNPKLMIGRSYVVFPLHDISDFPE